MITTRGVSVTVVILLHSAFDVAYLRLRSAQTKEGSAAVGQSIY